MPLCKPARFFYGWWIVGASFLIALYGGGVIFYGFTAFFEPIAEDLGWSYTQISIAASLRGLEMGLLAPLSGILADRWGPRRLIFAGVLISVAGLITLSTTTSIVVFYAAFALIAIGVSCSSLTVMMTAVANWFHKKMGAASGIVLCGWGFSGLLIPLIVTLIEAHGWRTAMVILALGMLVLLLPVSLVFRHKPESYGYLPDGQQAKEIEIFNNNHLSQKADTDVRAIHVLKNSVFWRLALSFAYHMMIMTAVLTHVMPYLSSIKFSRAISSMVATGIPVISVIGRLGLGSLGDRIDKRLVAAWAFAMIGLGLLTFGYVSTENSWLLFPFLVLFGIGYGGINPTRPSITREYFGRDNFGKIFGLIQGMCAIGSLTGPALAGFTYDTTGSYQIIWFIFAGLAIPAVIALLTVSPSQRVS